MITIDQAMRGFTKFVDYEVIPHLPTGKGIGAGIALALIMDGGKEEILKLRDNPAVKMMNVMDEQGNIDVDRLYNAARPRFQNKLTVTIPFIGDLRFEQNDIDKLLNYLKEG